MNNISNERHTLLRLKSLPDKYPTLGGNKNHWTDIKHAGIADFTAWLVWLIIKVIDS